MYLQCHLSKTTLHCVFILREAVSNNTPCLGVEACLLSGFDTCGLARGGKNQCRHRIKVETTAAACQQLVELQAAGQYLQPLFFQNLYSLLLL
ncbi:hypothetical protein E2320_021616, partial [Naja naja]